MDHRPSLRDLLAAEAHRPPLTGTRTVTVAAVAGAGCSGFDRGLGVRFVAGADEAGRGCLAGPLVAAAVLFDYERLSLTDRALAERAQRLQAAHARRCASCCTRGCCGRRSASSVTSRCVRGIDERGLHKTNLAALSRHAAARGRRGRRCACPTASRCPPTGFEQRHVVGGDATLGRDRRRVRDRQGHARSLHAADGGALSGLGVRDPRRLLHARAPRGDRASTASRRCTGCRSSRWRTSSSRSSAPRRAVSRSYSAFSASTRCVSACRATIGANARNQSHRRSNGTSSR